MPQFTYGTNDKSHPEINSSFFLVSKLQIVSETTKETKPGGRGQLVPWGDHANAAENSAWPTASTAISVIDPRNSSRCSPLYLRETQDAQGVPGQWGRRMEEMQGRVSCAHQMLQQTLAKSRDGWESVTLLFCDDCLEIESSSAFTFINTNFKNFGLTFLPYLKIRLSL